MLWLGNRWRRADVSGWPAGVEDARALLPEVAFCGLAGSSRWKSRATALSTSPGWGHGDIWEAFSTSAPQPVISPFVREDVFSVLTDANCSFLASICSSAYFLQDFTGILGGPLQLHIVNQRSACSLVLLKRSFCGHGIYGQKTKQNKTENPSIAFPIPRHNHSFRYVDCTSRLIFILFKSKFSSAQTKGLTAVKNILAPEARENSNSVVRNAGSENHDLLV